MAVSQDTVREPLAWTTADGITLRGTRFGPAAAAQSVFFFHGGGQTRHAWKDTAFALADLGYAAITVDHRGHGDSDWARDRRYRLDDFASDVARLAASVASPPVIVAASLGGMAALVAVAQGAPARGLVLVDVVPHFELTGAKRVIEFMRTHTEGFATLTEAADAVAGYLPHRPRPVELEGLKKNLRQTPEGRWVWRYDPTMLEPEFVHEALSSTERLAHAARSIAVPTLVLRGQLSDMVSTDSADRLLELIPHATIAEVIDAAHMVAGDENATFTARVVEFLLELDRGSTE